MPIFAVKTTARQEQTVADMIAMRKFEQIHAVLASDSLMSYVVVEADDNGIITRVLEEIPHAHGLVGSSGAIDTSNMAEVGHFLSPTPDAGGIAEGDIVELIASPFRGEKAHVQRIDETKGQVIVELYEATVPIPITVRSDQIRILDSKKR